MNTPVRVYVARIRHDFGEVEVYVPPRYTSAQARRAYAEAVARIYAEQEPDKIEWTGAEEDEVEISFDDATIGGV